MLHFKINNHQTVAMTMMIVKMMMSAAERA